MSAATARSLLLVGGLGAAWLLGLAAVLQLLDILLPAAAIGTAILGALVADLIAGRAGVRWGDAGASHRPAMHALAGAGVALVAALGVVAVAASQRWLAGAGNGMRPSPALFWALVRAAATAVRDELLYRGIPLVFAARAGIAAPWARAFAALAGGAAIVGLPGVSPAAVVLATALGWLFAALWQRSRGAWAPVGAHTAWLLFFGSVLHGGLFDLDWVAGNLAIGATSHGAPAWLAAAVLVVAATSVTRLRLA